MHTADVLGLRNLFVRRTTFVRCSLIDGKEFVLVDRGMLNGNGMEATARRIIAYWHRQCPAASGCGMSEVAARRGGGRDG